MVPLLVAPRGQFILTHTLCHMVSIIFASSYFQNYEEKVELKNKDMSIQTVKALWNKVNVNLSVSGRSSVLVA